MYKEKTTEGRHSLSLSRRRFVQGLAAGGAIAALDWGAGPGDGLNANGRRVLTYADLRSRYRGVDGRPPSREIELHLTGNMERYIWGFNGKKFSTPSRSS